MSQTTPRIDGSIHPASPQSPLALPCKNAPAMTLLNPYLNFNGQCREALTFYQQCLEGDLELQKVAESPMATRMPSEKGAHILHGALSKNGTVLLMGSDMIGNDLHPGNSVNLCLNCTRASGAPPLAKCATNSA